MDILRPPYCHWIMGFAYIGKPANHSDSLQSIYNLFYPCLHPVTTTTLAVNHTIYYVVDKKTHYSGLEDPIYVRADELIKFTTQSCVELHHQSTLHLVTGWKNENFYDIFGEAWENSLSVLTTITTPSKKQHFSINQSPSHLNLDTHGTNIPFICVHNRIGTLFKNENLSF